ncbi:MAG: HD domain-containing protein [Blastocatellia bacterium]
MMENDAVFTLPDSRLDLLRESWMDLTGIYRAPQEASRIYEELTTLYASPDRAYHNLSHIDWLLEEARGFQASLRHYDAVRMAIWFHDAIYETSRSDNEERSADLAERSLAALGAEAETATLVRAMIVATNAHTADKLPEDGRLFLDLDLSILGSDEAVYNKYARAIRKEYAWVPSLIYKRKRRKVLESLLDRKRIFFTDAVFEARESLARRNIGQELSKLRGI